MGRGISASLLLWLALIAQSSAAEAPDAMREWIGRLAGLGSRLAGFPGNSQASEMVKEALAGIPGVEVGVQQFIIPVLKEKPAAFSVRDQAGNALLETSVHALWPNGLYPSTTPEGLSGPLVYVGKGRLSDFDGKSPEGAVLLVDFDSGMEWLNGPLLGAKAALFIEPEEAYRGEAEAKFISTWLDYPRYWLPEAIGRRLIEAANAGAECSLKGMSTYVPEVVENVYGFLAGASPHFSDELVILSAYIDAASVVPAIAPGAEAAANLAIFLEVARAVAEKGSPRPVLFLLTNAHSNGLAGARYFYDLLNSSAEELQQRLAQLRLDLYLLEAKRALAERMLETGTSGSMLELARRLAATSAGADELRTLCKAAGLMALFRQRDEPDELARLTADDFREYVSDREARLLDELAPLRTRSGLSEEEAAAKELLEAERLLASRSAAKVRHSRFYTGLGAEEKAAVDAAFGRYLGDYLASLDERIVRARQRLEIERHNGSLYARLKDFKRLIWLGLDVSSHAQKLALLAKGHLYDQRGTPERSFAPLAANLMSVAQETEAELGAQPGSLLIDAIRREKGRDWASYLACQLALDAEVATTAGEAKDTRVKSRGVSLASSGDARARVDTPHDTPERLDWENLRRFRDFLVLYVPEVLKEDGLCQRLGLDDRFTNFAVLDGNAVRRGGVRSIFESTPVSEALVQGYHWTAKTFAGVRAEYLETTDFDGRFHMPGIRFSEWVNLEAAWFNPEGGRPEYVLDKGQLNVQVAETYRVRLATTKKYAQVKMFEARPLAVFDLVDQRFLRLLRAIDVYDARRENVPISFGSQVRGEPAVVVWAKKHEMLKVVLKEGQIGTRMALLNAGEEELQSEGRVRGRGFHLEETATVPLTSYQAARDMFLMDEWRLKRLGEHNIKNRRIEALHEEAGLYLKAANEYRAQRKFSGFLEAARSAWGLESRAYPDVRNTQDDTINGVVFYLFLVLPFAFFWKGCSSASPR